MNMIELIIGAAAGAVGGVVVSNKMANGDTGEKARLLREQNLLNEENEKLRKRLKEADRQVEDLLAANKRLRNEAKTMEADGNDVEDELSSAKQKVKSLTRQNDELQRQLAEYKQVCASYELQIQELKRG